MPIAINTSRPPSATTVPANHASRTTTTSRRGGRTRSRSPPAMGSRMSGNGGGPEAMTGVGVDNPSSAAAAAAAAAKAFSSGAGRNPPTTWPDEEAGVFHMGYDKPYGGSAGWPHRDERPYSPPSRRFPGMGGYHGGRDHHAGSPPGQYPPHLPPHPSHAPPPHHVSDSRRYRDVRSPYDSIDSGRGPRHSSRGYYPQDYRYPAQPTRSSEHRGHSSSSASSSKGHGGTSLVIGGATPIHVPKSADIRRASAASVFRGRPDVSTTASRTSGPDELEEDSPQKILLSLRTPSTSFEEKGSGNGGGSGTGNDKLRKSTGLTLSPEEPPKIQNSNQSRPSEQQLFDRSPEGATTKLSASIEMAPSFTLFNQSFDSFGDSHYFNVDATLQNDSFGMPRTNSIEHNEGNGNSAPLIQRNTSGGNFSQQLLTTSGSGALTIGYSPVNSFGNASTSLTSRRSGSNMVLGGPDTRAASPTQVLGMYPSYSGGGGAPSTNSNHRSAPLEDSHMRMSVGSFGGQSITFNRSYDPSSAASQPSNYFSSGPVRSSNSPDRTPPFYIMLRKYKAAFKDCTFLLPGLKAALLEAPLSDRTDGEADPVESNGPGAKWDSTTKSYSPTTVYGEPNPQDTAIARRRIEASVCAFGGNLNRDLHSEATTNRSSIFRNNNEESESQQSATVTPSSTESHSNTRFHSRARMKYEEALPGRYYENESRLSWEFEENPPVEVTPDDDGDIDKGDGNNNNSGGNNVSSNSSVHSTGSSQYASKGMSSKDSKGRQDSDIYCKQVGEDMSETSSKRPSSSSPQPKMKYRCKLCGQPKQNHRCPYQQSLARSIGVMVYPSVNAFAASEPGVIAAPLSEMNNFVDLQRDAHSSNENSPNRPTPERLPRVSGKGPSSSTQVTPETMRSPSSQLHSPSSYATNTPVRSSSQGRTGGRTKKRSHSQLNSNVGSSEDQGDLLFVETMDLKPEQFRIVSPSKTRKTSDAYCYPALPLPYAQRKRLSDNLFSLSNEVPKLTDECAQVLREAREKDMWDLAVAELMTQVIVVIHCPDGDSRFEGLRQYLLTLGIAC